MILEGSVETCATLGLLHKYHLCGKPNAPLVYLVHGRAGNFDVMWTFRRCLPDHCDIIAPQAPLADRVGGYSWWDVESSEGLAAAHGALKALLSFMTSAPQAYMLNPPSMYALGFSQGAGLLSLIIQEYPSLLSAAALLAGFVIPSSAPARVDKYPPVLMLHGSQDTVVPLSKALKGKETLEQRGINITFHQDPVGHKIGAPGMRLLKDWLTEKIAPNS